MATHPLGASHRHWLVRLELGILLLPPLYFIDLVAQWILSRACHFCFLNARPPLDQDSDAPATHED